MEHTILVAFTVEADNRELAENILKFGLPTPVLSPITSWWVAEDDRNDGSDCDSAVFVTPGLQRDAHRFLTFAGMTPEHNGRYGVNANDHSPEAARQRERFARWEPDVPDDTPLDLLMRVGEDISRDEFPDPEDIERLRAMFNPTD